MGPEAALANAQPGKQKGIHVQSRGNEPLPTDLVKALKTQDATYIRMQATMEQGVGPLPALSCEEASLTDLCRLRSESGN